MLIDHGQQVVLVAERDPAIADIDHPHWLDEDDLQCEGAAMILEGVDRRVLERAAREVDRRAFVTDEAPRVAPLLMDARDRAVQTQWYRKAGAG